MSVKCAINSILQINMAHYIRNLFDVIPLLFPIIQNILVLTHEENANGLHDITHKLSLLHSNKSSSLHYLSITECI